MVGCLLLSHKTITNLTKIKLLRAMFHEEDFEIHMEGGYTVAIYLWNVKKMVILQAALAFESELIATGVGFGKRKKDALAEAQQVFAF